jgi:hypothetical protein
MTSLKDLTNDQIQRIIVIKKKIEKLHTAVQKRVEKLESKIDAIAGDGGVPTPSTTKPKKHRMSRAGRAAIAAAARARWAKAKANGKTAL